MGYWTEDPSRYGPVPSCEYGPQYQLSELSTSFSTSEWAVYMERFRAALPRIRANLQRIAARLSHRRTLLPWWDTSDWGPAEHRERRRLDIRRLMDVILKFRGAPVSMMEVATEWAAFRRRLEMDEPLQIWNHQTASVGIILGELHWVEEILLSL